VEDGKSFQEQYILGVPVCRFELEEALGSDTGRITERCPFGLVRGKGALLNMGNLQVDMLLVALGFWISEDKSGDRAGLIVCVNYPVFDLVAHLPFALRMRHFHEKDGPALQSREEAMVGI
jgi:hypothetical protein